MTKLTKSTVCIFLSALVAMLCACASTAHISEQNKAQVAQNRLLGLPLWAECSFTSTDAPAYIPGYRAAEKGLFCAGSGNNSTQARLDTRAKLASSINSETLIGSRIVDSYTSDNGTVYILMFISEKDAKESSGE